MMRSFVLLLVSSLFTVAAQAACVEDNAEVTLSGVLEGRVIKMDPNDFGWVPADGKVPYTVLVLDTPVCINVDGVDSEQLAEVQVALQDGVVASEGDRITATGSLFGALTAHHFPDAVLLVEKAQ